MTWTSFPFESQDTTEDQYTLLFQELADSGVVGGYHSGALQVTANASGMEVTIRPGSAIVRGHMVVNSDAHTVPISASASSERRDRIVLRLDPEANTIEPVVLEGTPGASLPPRPTQDKTGVYELPLAAVSVPQGSVSVPASALTDERPHASQRVGVWSTDTRPTFPQLGLLGYNTTLRRWEYPDRIGWHPLVESINWSTIEGRPETFPAAGHSHSWDSITGKPRSFPPGHHSHSWGSITGKPSTFSPSSHRHSWSSITGKPKTYRPSGHSHSKYLTSGSTIAWANGSKRVRGNSPRGSSTWYSVWIDGYNKFCKNTSSRRFKQNIRPHALDPADVLALRPVLYDRKPDNDGEDAPRDQYGLIAEEVEQHLPELVTHDEDGQTDTVRYDLLGVALLDVVKNLTERVRDLEDRLADKENPRP
ncbi:tail fiber domain-containing protein [Salininema proteolyticum]|uniref:Tail fiber domain-containing protein n=1 Tax=Salininema proteolyticum TaxID=1607685 RepID=A0ABV8TZB0_9ACTN